MAGEDKLRFDHATPEQLSALLDRELPPSEADEVQAHLQTCAECRTELDRLTATVSLLKAMPLANPPRSFRLETPPARRQILRFPTWRLPSPVALRAFAGAAAALMVVVFTADALRPGSGPSESPAMPALARAPSAGGGAAANQFRAEAETREVRDAAAPGAPVAARSAPQAGAAPVASVERPDAAAALEAPATGAVDVGAPSPPVARTVDEVAPRSPPVGSVGAAAPRQVVGRESGQTGVGWTPGRLGAVALAVAAAGLFAASFVRRRAAA